MSSGRPDWRGLEQQGAAAGYDDPVKRTRLLRGTFGILLCALLPGCGLVGDILDLPVKAVDSVMPGTPPSQIDVAALQIEIERYADEFTSQSVSGIDEYARKAGTDDARSRALVAKLALSSSAFSIASGPNPFASLLDFIALATVIRKILEDEEVQSREEGAYLTWLEVSRTLEAQAWALGEGVLTAEQKEELRGIIDRWHEKNNSVSILFFARPQGLTEVFRQLGTGKEKTSSLLGLVGLDPTAALDPAVREVARTRLLAERALYTAQRMPYILRWHVEVLADRFFRHDEIGTAVASAALIAESADRMSRAVESASEVAGELPDRLALEREAILGSLEAGEGKMRELSAEFRQTLAQAEKTFAALDTAVTSFDALMHRFGVEPKTERSPEPPPEPGSKPFDILEYAQTAEKLAVMAKDLDSLLEQAEGTLDSPALGRSIAEVEALSARAAGEAKSILNHAFLLGAGLVLLVFACALLWSRFAPRQRAARSHRQPELRS